MKKQRREFIKIRRWGALALSLVVLLCLLVSCSKSESISADQDGMELYVQNVGNTSGTTKPGSGGATPEEGTLSDTSQIEEEYEVKIIRTANLSAETKEFDRAVEEIEASLTSLGGYVASSEITGRNFAAQAGGYGSRRASYSLRIPAEKLDEFLAETGELVNLLSSSTTAEDVSGEYYDVEARLGVLRTEQAVLEDMLARSQSVESMITVEKRLYDIICEIETCQTRLKLLDSRVSYSTVELSLAEVTDLTVVAKDNSFGARFKQAVSESWHNFVDFCRDFVIWLVYALPGLLLFAIAATVISVVTVRLVRRRRRRRAETERTDSSEE